MQTVVNPCSTWIALIIPGLCTPPNPFASRHRKRFGEAAYDDRPIIKFARRTRPFAEIKVAVNFVRYYQIPVPFNASAICFRSSVLDLPGWIRWRDHDSCFRFLSDLRSKFEISKPNSLSPAFCSKQVRPQRFSYKRRKPESSGRAAEPHRPHRLRTRCVGHCFLRPHVTTTPVRADPDAILFGYLFTQFGNSRMRGVAILLVARNTCGLIPQKLRRRQVRLTQSEIDRIRQCSFKELTDQCRLKSPHSPR